MIDLLFRRLCLHSKGRPRAPAVIAGSTLNMTAGGMILSCLRPLIFRYLLKAVDQLRRSVGCGLPLINYLDFGETNGKGTRFPEALLGIVNFLSIELYFQIFFHAKWV